MAKRRLLKKDINYVSGDLFTEVLICSRLIPGVDQEKVEVLMARILDMHDEFIRHAHTPDGKDNKGRVKNYYNKLIQDLQIEVNAIGKEIEELSKGKLG